MLNLAIDEAKVAWTLAFVEAPREVLTAYGQSITLEGSEGSKGSRSGRIIGRACAGGLGPV